LPSDIQKLVQDMESIEQNKISQSELWTYWMSATEESTHLTILDAYKAMQNFLDVYCDMTGSENLASILGGLQLHPDGQSWDPAAWEIWVESTDDLS
jgi:hypothetical protein